MRGWAGLIGTFLPFLVLLVAAALPLRGKRLWLFSLGANLFSFACLVIMMAGFYTGAVPEGGEISAPLMMAIKPWAGNVSLVWSYQSGMLALAASAVMVCYHFLGKARLIESRAKLAGMAAYLVCLQGALGADHLFLFALFFAGSLVPRVVFAGIDSKQKGIDAAKETAFLGVVALFCILICVLVFTGPFKMQPREWFELSNSAYVALPGAIGFSLLLFAAALAAGIFPFHGNTRKAFDHDFSERSVPLALQPLFGFTLLFHFSVELFAKEFRLFGPYLLGLFSLGLAACALGFLGSRAARDRVFWLSQAMSCLVAIGFFTMNSKGWHGANVVLFFQALVIPYFLAVLSCHERRPGPIAIDKIKEVPYFALSTVSAVLFGLFLPVSLGFYGVLLVIWSMVGASIWFLGLVVAAIPLIAFAGIKVMYFRLEPAAAGTEDGKMQDLSRDEIFALLPVGAALFFFGLVPKVVLGPMGVSAAALLRGLGIK
jgi:NADH:ubiquinone oxidoreductase subunit 4 (subunit M)